MIWSLDMDDFNGICYGKKYPLLKSITEYINKQIPNVKKPTIDLTANERFPSLENKTAVVVSFDFGPVK